VTVPVGTGPAAGAATVTVKVTGWAKTEGFAFSVTMMLTAAEVPVCAITGDKAAERNRAAIGALALQVKRNTSPPLPFGTASDAAGL
jgi:hypothetical protein